MKVEYRDAAEKLPDFMKFLSKKLDGNKFRIRVSGDGYSGIIWRLKRIDNSILPFFDPTVLEMYTPWNVYLKMPEYYSDAEAWIKEFERVNRNNPELRELTLVVMRT